MKISVLKKSVVAAFSAVALLSGSVAAAPPAALVAHDDPDGVCESGEFCLYYNSVNINDGGSLRDFRSNVWNYGTGSDCLKYISPGPGQGQCVKNNAASAWNRTSAHVSVFYNSGHKGSIDNFSPYTRANLRTRLKNDNASHYLGRAENTTMEYGLYKSSAGRITAYFDGYVYQDGRHEGIDFARYEGAPVYALLSGRVERRKESGVSWLAIYNSYHDKTVFYLHINPRNTWDKGDYVSTGTKIGWEDDRGAGSQAHTHVEVRKGKHDSPSKSVDDPVLDNFTPTLWWHYRGYNTCCRFS